MSPTTPTGHYFYQSADGELVFLHSLSFKPLFAQAGKDWRLLPREITATVLDVEMLKVTPAARQKLPFMHHLPLQCNVLLVELDMQVSIN